MATLLRQHLSDVLATIRSRCRHLGLRTPSTKAVAKLLMERDLISEELATFAAKASQGHIGVARYLATDKQVRDDRLTTLKDSLNDYRYFLRLQSSTVIS